MRRMKRMKMKKMRKINKWNVKKKKNDVFTPQADEEWTVMERYDWTKRGLT
jgi:hypothetical protein